MEQVVIAVFLAFFALEFLVEFGLNEINIDYVRQRRGEGKIPAPFQGKISPEDFQRSVDYTLARSRFDRWTGIYGGLVTLLILFSGLLPYLDRVCQVIGSRFSPSTQATGILFCLGTGLVLFFLSLPTGIYSTFVIEARFGFNKTTAGLYLMDKVKGLFLGAVIGVPFFFALLWLMQASGDYWWLWAFLFVLGFELLMMVIYPMVIAPLFNKFEPLKEGELRERILALADRVGFRTSGIFTMDGSKRSTHSNAFFTGMGKAKRIVLFDTLLQQMTTDQGLAVLAHEMGHYKMKHIRKMLAIRSILLLLGLYILASIIDFAPFFRAFGLEPSNYAALVLFGLVSGPFALLFHPWMSYLSRRHEYEADRFAVRTLRHGKPMEEALLNLTVKNLTNLTPHPWYSFYHYSHPAPLERIGAIRREADGDPAMES